MPKAVVWLEEQPVVTVDAAGVKIEYASGNQVYTRRCSRAFMRRHCELALRVLNEYDLRERCEIVPFKGDRGGH